MRLALRSIITLFAFAAIVTAVLLLVAFYPMFHNRFIFPLGRLYGSIELGLDYEEVHKQFQNYYERHKKHGEIYLNEAVISLDRYPADALFFGCQQPCKLLSLYHQSAFDRVQLKVVSYGNTVDRIQFIGD